MKQEMKHNWFLYTLLTVLLWGGWGLVSKPVSDRLAPWQVQTVSALGLLPVIAVLGCSKNLRRGANPPRGFRLAFVSGAVATIGNIAYYKSLSAGGKAAAVTPLTALYPVVTIVSATLILHERFNRVQMTGVLAALAAIYLFNVGNEADWLTPWLAVALVPIALWGASALLQKCAALSASSELATIGFLLGALPISAATPLLVSMNWRLPMTTWGLAVAVGLLFGLGNLTLMFAYGSGGKASVVTPLAGLYSVVTIALAVVLLGEHVSRREGLGIALALGAAAALGYEKPAAMPNNVSRDS
jgi:transporter family protein